MYCSKCGSLIERIGQQFCSNCGTATKQASSSNAPIPNSTYTPQNFAPIYPSNNSLAVIGFVVSLFCCGPIGIALSAIGLSQINKEPRKYKGKGFAIAGIILGIISIVVGLLYYGWVMTAVADEFIVSV